jgi:hypothetical protein
MARLVSLLDLKSRYPGKEEETPKGKDSRLSAKAAGYMELKGAVKDADCQKVRVEGGVSSDLGCCNKFQPDGDSVRSFRCGVCSYLSK